MHRERLILFIINTIENYYLAVTAFLVNGSNLTKTLFTGLRFNKNTCFLIALTKPADFDFEPENGKDIVSIRRTYSFFGTNQYDPCGSNSAAK